MVDIRQDARFVDFLSYKNMTVDAFEALDEDAKASISGEMDEWKKENPIEEEQEAKYSIEEAVEIALNQNLNMMPDELVALNDTLKEASKVDKEAEKAYNNVQKAIGIKTTQYAKGQIGVDIDNADDMLALLDAYDVEGKSDDVKETKKKAQERLDNFTKAYDEENGLTGLTKEDSKHVDVNSTELEGIGNENLFEREVFVEKDIVPMPFDKAKEILADKTKPLSGLSLQDFASLQASMQIYSGSFSKEDNYVVSKAARAKVLTVANSKADPALNKEDFKSFDFILAGVEKSAEKNDKLIDAKKLNKAKDILKDQREVIANTVTTKNPEMQEAYDLLSAIKVTGKLKRFSREEIPQLDENGAFVPDSEVGLFIESIKERTKQQMLGSKEGVTPEAFKSNFSENLQVAIFELYGAERVALGKTSPKDIKETYDKLVALSKNKKISINQEAFAGYAALKNKESNSFIKRLEKKTGNTQAVQTTKKNNKDLDKRNEQVHGDKYKGAKKFFRQMGKTAFKAAAWSTAFSVAATYGAPAVIGVAALSLGVQVKGAIKGYKQEKLEAIKKGEKPKGFWGYIKKNPAVGIGMFTSSLGAIVPGLEMLGEAGKLGAVASSLTPHLGSFRFGSTLAASAHGAYKPIVNAFKNPSKENTWGALTAIGGVAVGMVAGRIAGGQMSEYMAGDNTVDNSVDGISGAAVQVQPPATTLNSDMNPNYDYSDFSSRFNFTDANNNGVIDFLERPELSNIGLTADANGNGVPDYLEVNAPEQAVEQTLETKTQPTQEPPVQETVKEQAPEQNQDTTKEQAVENDTKQTEQSTQEDKTTVQDDKQSTQGDKVAATEEKLEQTQINTREDQPAIQPQFTPEELAATDRAMAEQDFQAMQTAAYNQTYTMTDSLGQTADYQVSPDGNIVFTNVPEGFTGHGDMGNDIAKDIMARVESGNATEGDLKAIEKYSGDKELLADAQAKFESGKESFIAGKQEQYAEARAELSQKGGEELAENKSTEPKGEEKTEEKPQETKTEEKTEEKPKETKAEEKTEEKPKEVKTSEPVVSDLKVAGFDSRTVDENGTIALKNDKYAVSYNVNEKGDISIGSKGSINPDNEVRNHCSKMYKLDNGNYKMGDSVSSNMSAVQMMANNDLRTTTIHNAIYSDMEARLEAGEQLADSEKRFMERHEAKLDRLGLHRDEDGKMQVGKESDVKANTHQASVDNTPKEPDYKISRDGTLTYNNNSSPDVKVPDDVKASLNVEENNGRYKIGGATYKSEEVAMQKANLDLNNIYKNNEAYNDLAEKRDSGVELDKRETKFMANHEKKMDSYNLTNKDGQIEVKETSGNDKQLANDKTQSTGKQSKGFGIEERRAGFADAKDTVETVKEVNTVLKGIGELFSR